MERKENHIYETALKVWNIEGEEVMRLKEVIAKEQFEAVVRMLAECRGKILISGCGTSGAAAKKAAHSLCCVECPACFLSPSDAVHGALGMLQKEDVLILLSKGGQTQELIPMAKAAQKKKAGMIVVTENEKGPLSELATVSLRVSVAREACPFNMLATASTMAVVAVFDAICVALMHLTGYTKEQFLTIHPSGAVGNRLQNETTEK